MKKINKELVILSIIIIGLIFRLFISWQKIETLLQKILIDDAFIAFSISRNIANGNGISFDGISLTNGFQPLWIFIIVSIFKIIKNELAINLVLTIASIIDTITIFLIYRIGEKIYGEKIGLLSSMVYSINPLFLFFTLNGIEVALTVFLINITILYFISIKNFTNKKIIFLGLLLGITVLSRLDSIFLVFSICVILLWKVKKIDLIIKNFFILGITIFLIASPWLMWNYINFGTFIPSSGKAVYNLGHMICDIKHCNIYDITKILFRNFLTGIFSLTYYFGIINSNIINIIFGLIILYFLFIGIKKYNIFLSVSFIYICLIFLFYSAYIWRLDLRYFTASSSLLLITLCNGIFTFAKKIKYKFFILSFILSILLTNILINANYEWNRGYVPWQIMMYEGGLWVKNNTKTNIIIASFNSGLIGYYSERSNINLDGVINFEAIQAIEKNNITNYIKSKNVSYLLDTVLDIRNENEDIDLWNINPWTKYMGEEFKSSLEIQKINIKEFEIVGRNKMKTAFFIAKVIN